jgi:hypothetical protein
MLLALAIATLWCHELGEYVLAGSEDRHREIDPGLHRELTASSVVANFHASG